MHMPFRRHDHEHKSEKELLLDLLQEIHIMASNVDRLAAIAASLEASLAVIQSGGGASEDAALTKVEADAAAIAAQVGGNTGTGIGTGNGTATVTVSPTSASMTAGQVQALTVSAFDAQGNAVARAPLTFHSINTGVATVDQSGNITAVAAGNTTVVVTAGPSNVAQASVSVTVTG